MANLILIMAISFVIVNLTGAVPRSQELEFEELYDEFRRVRQNMSQEITNFDEKLQWHTTAITRRMKIHFNTSLKKRFSVCYDQAIESLTDDISDMLKDVKTIPCFVSILVKRMKMDSILDKFTSDMSILFHQIRVCMNNPELCQYHPKYEISRKTIFNAQFNFSYQTDWNEQWPTSTACYYNLSSQIGKKISSLTLDNENCNWMSNYKDFLMKLSIWPLELGNLVDLGQLSYSSKAMSENHGLENMWIDDSERISRLIGHSIRITRNLQNYVESVEEEIVKIINPDVFNVQQKLLNVSYTEELSTSEAKRDCFIMPIVHMMRELEEFYKSSLRSACFHQISEVTHNFNSIQSNITGMVSRLRDEHSCWAMDECYLVESMIEDAEMLMDTWNKFDLSRTWDFAKNCYKVATSVILQNLEEHKTLLAKCQIIPLTVRVFANLPISDEQYPIYDLSSFPIRPGTDLS